MNDNELKNLLQEVRHLTALQLKALSEYCDSLRWQLERDELARLKQMGATA